MIAGSEQELDAVTRVSGDDVLDDREVLRDTGDTNSPAAVAERMRARGVGSDEIAGDHVARPIRQLHSVGEVAGDQVALLGHPADLDVEAGGDLYPRAVGRRV